MQEGSWRLYRKPGAWNLEQRRSKVRIASDCNLEVRAPAITSAELSSVLFPPGWACPRRAFLSNSRGIRE